MVLNVHQCWKLCSRVSFVFLSFLSYKLTTDKTEAPFLIIGNANFWNSANIEAIRTRHCKIRPFYEEAWAKQGQNLEKHAKVMYLKLTLVEIIDVFSWLVYNTTSPFTQENIFFHWVYIAYISNFNKGEDGSNIVITCQKLEWTRTQFQPVCQKCILILTILYSNWKTTKGDNQKTIEHSRIHYWSKTQLIII